MIDNFKSFGIEHILSILIAISIGTIFIYLSKKYPEKRKTISIIFAITIIVIRLVRYVFDIYYGTFLIMDLFSIHICHIDLILLAICLFKPNEKIAIFTFLIGIPTALAVALLPGKIHQEPGMLRAIFFIMSHMMLVMGAIYLSLIYKFRITIKDLKFYYLFAFLGIIVMYIGNILANANFMYLVSGPKGTILEKFDNILGPIGYLIIIYLLLIFLVTILYVIYNLITKQKQNILF